MRVRTISVVTPCRNAEALIGPTLRSVLDQRAVASGRLALQYVVVDGASSDATVERVRALAGDRVELVSEPDTGMYDALAKGLRRCRGEVVAYLNAGDLYDLAAFDVVADVVEGHGVRWLTGMRVARNERLEVVEVLVPFRYRRALVRQGAYGKVLPFLQQESTFWERSLLEAVDLEALARLRYAGDFLLWRSFAARAELVVVEAQLGSFTYHPGQRSEDMGAYREEFERLSEPFTIGARFRAELDRRLWVLPSPLKKRLAGAAFLRYDLRSGAWR